MCNRAGLLAPILATAALAACVPESSIPEGASMLDENIVLVRRATLDSATRKFTLDADSVIVAFAEEDGQTDVQLRIESLASGLAPSEDF